MKSKAVLILALILMGCTSTEPTKVERVIDGDTLELSNGTKVRLLGINTPEKGEPFYEDAKRELQWIEGSRISLQRDVVSIDKYDRLLSYVWFEGELINKRLVDKGLAHVYRTKNKLHEQELLEAERVAREQELGLWARSNESCVELLELDEQEELAVFSNACPFEVNMTGWTLKDETTKSYDFVFVLDKLVRVHSGKGVDNSTDVYWNAGNVWNNDYDRLFLRNEDGLLVVFYEY
ncbi:thermonuclease family protein [archaeon]|nr:thermonuclease family protein [archaeon]